MHFQDDAARRLQIYHDEIHDKLYNDYITLKINEDGKVIYDEGKTVDIQTYIATWLNVMNQYLEDVPYIDTPEKDKYITTRIKSDVKYIIEHNITDNLSYKKKEKVIQEDSADKLMKEINAEFEKVMIGEDDCDIKNKLKLRIEGNYIKNELISLPIENEYMPYKYIFGEIFGASYMFDDIRSIGFNENGILASVFVTLFNTVLNDSDYSRNTNKTLMSVYLTCLDTIISAIKIIK